MPKTEVPKEDIIHKCISLGEYLASTGKNAAARHTFKKTLASPMVPAKDKQEITQKLAKVDAADRELAQANVTFDVLFRDPCKLKVSPATLDLGMKTNSMQYDKLKEDIKERGIQVPLTLDKDEAVICGVTRLKVAQDLKLDKIPCIKYSSSKYQDIQRYALSDNLIRRQISKEEIKSWSITLKKMKGEVLPGREVGRPKGGRGKKEPTSVRSIAKAMGISKSTLNRAHAEAGVQDKEMSEKIKIVRPKLWVSEPPLPFKICKGKDLSRDKRFVYETTEQFKNKIQYLFDQLEKGETLDGESKFRTTENQ